MGIQNHNLVNFWQTKKPIKLLYGGRDSSKTKDAALELTIRAAECKMRVMCARQFQNRIEQSVYTEIKWAIDRLGFKDYFTITNNSIKCDTTGSEFFFYGIRRNLSDIKGAADIDILWIEEGEDLTKEQFDTIEPTIRKDGSMIIILFNPNLVTDYVWRELVLSKRTDIQKHHINYYDNPFLSNKSSNRIAQLKEMDYDSYLHIYEGQPKQDDMDSIIKRKWLIECIDAHKKLGMEIDGGKRIGYDVADSGDDLNAMALMHGTLLKSLSSWKGEEDELFESSVKVYNYALSQNALINYDENGVGAGVGSNIKRINGQKNTNIKYYGFNSAESPRNPNSLYIIDGEVTQQTNREYFENMKAQAWWSLADKVKATYRAVTKGEPINSDDLFSISGDLDQLEELITELSTPRKKQSANLRNMVEKKKDLLARGIKSPNLADAVVYGNFDITPREHIGAGLNSVSFF